jgi:hypothetical protein
MKIEKIDKKNITSIDSPVSVVSVLRRILITGFALSDFSGKSSTSVKAGAFSLDFFVAGFFFDATID